MLLKHTWLCVHTLHTQRFTCVLDLKPSRFTQQACYRRSTTPRPRGCFKITTFPLLLLCPCFHYWKQTNKEIKTKNNSTRSHRRQRLPTNLLPHKHCLSFQSIVPREETCLPQRKRGGQRATFRKALFSSGRAAFTHRANSVVDIPSFDLLQRRMLWFLCPHARPYSSMRSHVGSLNFLLFTTAPNSFLGKSSGIS